MSSLTGVIIGQLPNCGVYEHFRNGIQFAKGNPPGQEWSVLSQSMACASSIGVASV
jgi:hypothetical protein